MMSVDFVVITGAVLKCTESHDHARQHMHPGGPVALRERVEGGRAALQCDLLMMVLPGA